MRVYQIEEKLYGRTDRDFLERIFQKLLINFTWWVNRKDAEGNNIFEGGFLGLDNISVFDRTSGLPSGGLPRAGRRHELDGDVLPQPPRHRARARQEGPGLRGRRDQVLRALRLHRRRDQPRWARRTGACGTRRTATTTTCCGCPTAARSRSRRRRSRVSSRSSPWRSPTARPIASFADFAKRLRWFAKYRPELLHGLGDMTQRGVRGPRPPRASSTPTSSRASSRPCSTRRRMLLRTACARCRSTTTSIRSCCSVGDDDVHARLRAGRVDHAAVRRQLELARTGVVPAQLPADRGAAEARRRARRDRSRSSARPDRARR